MIATLCFAILLTLSHFGGARYIARHFTHPISFQARNHLGFGPEINSHLKIFSIDQRTLGEIGRDDISVEDWTALFGALHKSKVRAVYIDLPFSFPITRDEKLLQKFRDAAQALKPVVVAARHEREKINGLTPARLGFLGFDPGSLKNLDDSAELVYGPHTSLSGILTHVGHVDVEVDGEFKPLRRVSKEDVILHWSLQAIFKFESKDGQLVISDSPVPLNEAGSALVNLPDPSLISDRVTSLEPFLRRARSGQSLEGIDEGDIVLIFNDMSRATLVRTPVGEVPREVVMTSILNGALQGQWLEHLRAEALLLFAACFIGFVLAAVTHPAVSAGLLIFSTLLLIGGSLAIFAFSNVLISWGMPISGLLLTGFTVLADRIHTRERRARLLKSSLTGVVSPKALRAIVRSSRALDVEPRCQELTIMFIDIVGFSRHAMKHSADVNFKRLSDYFNSVRAIIHQYGGVVDRSLGEGLICYFGYQVAGQPRILANHAEAALDCAIRIQQEALGLSIAQDDPDSVIFPLRIGINSGEVHIGDLGAANRIEITAIGHVVNIAQRLEGACGVYRILCGLQTVDHLRDRIDLLTGMRKRNISIKNQEAKFEVYEHDPFALRPDLVEKAIQKFRKSYGRSIEDHRYSIPADAPIAIWTQLGRASLVDVSFSGLSVELEEVLGQGTLLKFTIDSQDRTMETALRDAEIEIIIAEVRWGREAGEGYRYGLMIKNLTVEQRQTLLNQFQRFLTAPLAKSS